MKLIVQVIFYFCLLSCARIPDGVNDSLKLAENNKVELEKVLSHYEQYGKDSQKYKAACFLIDNMKWHSGSEIKLSKNFWKLFLYEDSLIKLRINIPNDTLIDKSLFTYKQKEKKRNLLYYLNESTFNDKISSDLHNVSAEFLINTIDRAFENKNLEWNKNLSFEEFCEYILPYRFYNEPAIDLQKNLQTHFQTLINNDTLKNDPIKIVTALNVYLKYFSWDWDSTEVNYPDLGFFNVLLWNTQKMTCREFSIIEGNILRSIGIPVIEIYTPYWRINNLGHSWCCLLSENKELIPFSALYETPGIQKLEHSLNKASKLYMRTFEDQKDSPYYLKSNTEQIPGVFSSPCIKDVTNNFVPTHDHKLKIEVKENDNNLCYFCLFIYGEWRPIGWGQIDNQYQKVNFKNLPDGIVGLPCMFINNIMVPCGQLIQTNSNGNYTIIEPTEEISKIHVTRKYPVKTGLQVMNDEVLGTIIEGSNDRSFSKAVQLFTLTDTLQPYFKDYLFANDKSYRFYRLTAPQYSLHFAELEFLTNRIGTGVTNASPLPIFDYIDTIASPAFKLNGTLIGTRKDSLAFDNNNLTYTYQKILTVDFGKPERVNKIRILPRNADNGITIGNHYELFYWKDGWLPAGEQIAKYNFLEFPNIPKGTLYLLRNKTIGKEEQAFWYKNEKQLFMNN